MKITLVSDLHLEFGDIELVNTQGADVLILGGDILISQDLHDHSEEGVTQASIMNNVSTRQLMSERFRSFLKRVCTEFPNVIYVAGNHEFYHGKWPLGVQYLRDEAKKYNNLHFLEMDTVKIDDVNFVGGTIWTDMNKGDPITLHSVESMMNDFRIIRNSDLGFTKLKPSHVAMHHRKTVEYIKFVVKEKPNEKFVVVGHHAPTKLSVKPQYQDDHLMNGAYSSDLSEFILDHPQIKLWTHGHTHNTFDYMIGSTRIVCNPRGYDGWEFDTGFDPHMVIEV